MATSDTAAAERLLYSRTEAAAQLGIGISQMNELITRGEIDSLKLGRLRKIEHSALTAYIARLRARQAK
jgi:excisionase family DNA binding protein